jgi:hypothetical protein
MLLPETIQLTWLRSFCAAVSIWALIITGVFCRQWDLGFVWPASGLFLMCAAGVIWPRLLIWPYRGWIKLSRLYAQFAEIAVLRLAFGLVCVPVGLCTSPPVEVHRPCSRGTLWQPRNGTNPIGEIGTKRNTGWFTHSNWIVRYVSSSWHSGQMWRMALLPFLLLTRAFQSSAPELLIPEHSYTLF